ncbi:MAG TPA: FG-GAP-like repeat-containing protein [Vicinamibacterales bacterium]|jgi:tetratricopeptide (TPR) repeat protein|nr:FG-GAP-like repeat-containing protein [Vicinamibacterales bacterium]
MANKLDTTIRESTDLIETGLRLIDGLFRQVRKGIRPDGPADMRPVDATGPRTVDGAVSELSNRATRLASMTAIEDAPNAWRELLEDARDAFTGIDRPKDNGRFGLDVALSASMLGTQQILRGLSSHYTSPDGAFGTFVVNVLEVFDDAHVYATLQYREVLERYRDRIKRSPSDGQARIELARTLIKCGLYHEALTELGAVAPDPKYRADALHEMSVAAFRAGRYKDAGAYAREAMGLNGSHPRTRLLLWLAAQKSGGYELDVPADMRMQVRSGKQPTALALDDIASRVGLDKTSGGRGTAVFDYDGDGWLDVLVAAAHGGCTLYKNNGDGTFTDMSIPSGMDGCLTAFITTIGDYNNDGHPDIFVTRNGFFSGECSLYRNNGDGTFTEVTQEAGLSGWGPAFTASWVDYDGDGRLDLYVAYNLGSLFERKTKNRLFHNNGDGTFTDVTDDAGLVTEWPTIGSCWGDYDNDGRPDLFVSNSLGRSQLFHNNGDGTFTEVGRDAGIDMYGLGSICYFIDYDNDGWLDIVQNVWSDSEDVIHTLEHGEGPPDGQPIRVWRNNRDGTFSLRSRELGVTGCWGSMSGNAGDLNNDGWQDIVLGNGSPRMERVEPLTLLQSDGRRFHDVTFTAGLPITGKSHGVNMADLFGDGRMSLLVASGGAYPGDLLTVGAFCPKEKPGHYLNIRLIGVKSNRSAIGARIGIREGGREQHRLVSGGSQFGCLPLEQHFGLGPVTEMVDSIEIWWPSGLKQRIDGPLKADTTIQITEGDNRLEDVYAGRRKGIGAGRQLELA